MTAVGIESQMPPFMLVDIDVALLDIQEKVVGIILLAQLMLMVVILRFKEDLNIQSTSVVSKLGLDHDQDHTKEYIHMEKLSSDMLE